MFVSSPDCTLFSLLAPPEARDGEAECQDDRTPIQVAQKSIRTMPPQKEEPLMASGSPQSSPTSTRVNLLPLNHSVPFLKLEQPMLAQENVKTDIQSIEDFTSTVLCLRSRLDRLLDELEKGSSRDPASPLRQACLYSLRNRAELNIKQASVLVEGIDKSTNNEGRTVGKLRATFACVPAVQYLDTVELAMSCSALDGQLAMILDQLRKEWMLSDPSTPTPCFRVSRWVAPVLAFDIPSGRSTTKSVTGDGVRSLPLSLEVEPVVTFTAADLMTGKCKFGSIPHCSVEIESCKHQAQSFSQGAGTLGLAIVRVRVLPLNAASRPVRIWGEEEAEVLRIKEARA